jgi:hypothetical protein
MVDYGDFVALGVRTNGVGEAFDKAFDRERYDPQWREKYRLGLEALGHDVKAKALTNEYAPERMRILGVNADANRTSAGASAENARLRGAEFGDRQRVEGVKSTQEMLEARRKARMQIVSQLNRLVPGVTGGLDIDAADFDEQVKRLSSIAEKGYLGRETKLAGGRASAEGSTRDRIEKQKERAKFIFTLQQQGVPPAEIQRRLTEIDSLGGRSFPPRPNAPGDGMSPQDKFNMRSQADFDRSVDIFLRNPSLAPYQKVDTLRLMRESALARGLSVKQVDAAIVAAER